MEQGLPLYNGATKQEARQQLPQMPQLPRVQGMGEAFDRAVDAGLQALDKYSKLHDFGEQQRVEHEARLNDIEMQKGLQKGLTAKWGTRESFFNEDGTRNEDNIAAFKSRWQEANSGIQRSFMRRDSVMQDADYMSQRNDGLAERVELSTVRQEFENRRRAFDANYALAVEQNDIGGALHALDAAVEAGQILPAEAARRKLQLKGAGLRAAGGRARAGEPVSVEVNGTEYSGASAALAVAAAKEGVRLEAEAPAEDSSTEEPTIEETEQELLTLNADGGVPDLGLSDSNGRVMTLNERMLSSVDESRLERAAELRKSLDIPVDEQYENTIVGEGLGKAARAVSRFLTEAELVREPMTEEQKQWSLMPAADVREFFEGMDDSCRVRYVPLADGSVEYWCPPYAPEVVQRVAARANAAGEFTADDAGEMVVSISLDTMHENPAASVESVSKIFDGAGVYEALGAGDEAVGKVRVAALVQDAKERMEYGTNKLGMEAIKRMVAARSEELYKSRVSRVGNTVLNVNLKDTVAVLSQKEADYKKALSDWYIGQVQLRLLDAAAGGGQYTVGGSYASDVAVARDVLKQEPPMLVTADVLASVREKQEKQAAARGKALCAEAERYYGLLRKRKERKVEETAAEKAAEKAAERAEREAEKEREAEAKRAEQETKQRYAMERMRRRQSAWQWDGKQTADGEVPQCSVPEGVLKMMVEELGYDGNSVPYVVIGSKRVQVTGHHKGNGLRLNTPAAMLLQSKKEGMRVRGELGYSFEFKSVK